MIKLTTPETDALDCELNNPRVLQDRYSEMLEHARKLERERDEAREQYHQICSQTLFEINKAHEARDEAREERDIARLESEEINQELVNARKQIEGLNNFANERFEEIQKVRRERDEVREAIIATLEENRHLADGDDCTLAKLKSVVPDWK